MKRVSSRSPDTSVEALRAQYAALRRMSASERLRMMDDLTRLVRSMACEGVRRRHPDATEAEIEDLFCELLHGKEVAARVSAWRRQRKPST